MTTETAAPDACLCRCRRRRLTASTPLFPARRRSVYSLHEAAMEEQERQRRQRERNRTGLVRKLSLSKQSRLGIVKRAPAQRKAKKVHVPAWLFVVRGYSRRDS